MFQVAVCPPAVQQPGSGAELCSGCAAAGGLLSAASDAAAERRTSAAGTVLLPCLAVCVTPAGTPAHTDIQRQSELIQTCDEEKNLLHIKNIWKV